MALLSEMRRCTFQQETGVFPTRVPPTALDFGVTSDCCWYRRSNGLFPWVSPFFAFVFTSAAIVLFGSVVFVPAD